MSLWLPVCCLLLFRARLLDRQPLEGIAAVHGPWRECQLRAKEWSQNTDSEMLKSCFVQLLRKIFIPNLLSISPKKAHLQFTLQSHTKYVTKAPQVTARRGGQHPFWRKKDSPGFLRWHQHPSTSNTALRPSPCLASWVSNCSQTDSGMFK